MFDFYLDTYFWLMIAALLLQAYVYLGIFRYLAVHKAAKDHGTYPPLTVIIAAKYEVRNLRELLHLVLDQDYPDFEVIVIDDQSEDGTAQLLEDMQEQYPHLRPMVIHENVREFAGKKLALTLGIKAAKHEILVFTDADCRPASNKWLTRIAETYRDKETEIVLGFSPYERRDSLINLVIQFDTFYTALQYLSAAIDGDPYMGVGRNMSYKKSLFFRNKGFAPYLKVASGDDDLFVNRNASTTNTKVQLHEDSFVYSMPKESWGDWFRQKKRHIQSGKYYRKGDKRKLGLIWFSNFFFYASIVAGIILVKPFWIALAIFGLRLIIQMTIMGMALKKLKMSFLLAFTPLLDIFYQLVYLPVIGLIGIFTRKRKAW
jgi:glycosyltransferase involved in cell wall biosynthesis